jgi:hypothetical protein
MIVTADIMEEHKIAFMIPVGTLLKAWPELQPYDDQLDVYLKWVTEKKV